MNTVTTSNLAERYTRLCRAYVKLADKFQKLDVEHMTLRSKVVPLLKALKVQRQMVEQLQQEKTTLAAELQSTTSKYEALQHLEPLLQPDMQAALVEAEEQLALVDTTLVEMDCDRDPDLNDDDKQILNDYQQQPESFSLPTLPVAEVPGPSLPAMC